MLCKRGLCRHAVSVRQKRINKSSIFSPSGSQSILDFPYRRSWQYSDENPLTGSWNASEVGKNRDLSQYLAPSRAVYAYSAATDHGELMTLVGGKRRSLLMKGDDEEVYDKKPQRYTKDNGAVVNCTQ